jgi:hypothetical protein
MKDRTAVQPQLTQRQSRQADLIGTPWQVFAGFIYQSD